MIDKIVLGTVQLGMPYGINNALGKPNEKECIEILNEAFASGIRTLDTARAYGSALQIIGNYHKSSSNKFKVINKFHANSAQLSTDVQVELDELQIGQFEAYLFHSFSDFRNADSQLIKELIDLKKKALFSKIGVSVYGNEQFEMAIQNDVIDMIQFPYNLFDNASKRGDMIRLAKSRGKELHVRSVFLQGLFFMEENTLPEKMKAFGPYLRRIKLLAQNESISMQELAISYALNTEGIDKVLIGVDSLNQLRTNLQVITKVKALPGLLKSNVDGIDVKEVDLLSPINWN